jgi:sugar lactone lactonase YvrE
VVFYLVLFLSSIYPHLTSVLASDGATYVFSQKWLNENDLKAPESIAVDNIGNVYVYDRAMCLIHKFTSDGKLISTWGSGRVAGGSTRLLYGIAVDPSGNIYGTNDDLYCVEKFTPDGELISKWGQFGSGDGQFGIMMGIAVDSDGNIYVVDTNNFRIQKFTTDGKFVCKWGSVGSGDGQFIRPYGIAVDRIGNVYVSEITNQRIQKFTSDGRFICKWGSVGSGDGQFNGPWGIAVDSIGNVYVSEYVGCRIQKFTSDGKFITKWGSMGSGDGQFNRPHGVAVDGSGNVYVADTDNERIQKFTGPAIVKNEVKILSVPYYAQSNQNWCALCSLSMILSYYGYPVSPWTIVTATKLPATSPFTYDMIMNYLQKDFPYKNTIKIEDITPSVPLKLQQDQVINWIKKGVPVFLGITSLTLKGIFSHAVVVTGYNQTAQTFLVNDPSGALFDDFLKGEYSYSKPYIEKAVKWDDLNKWLTQLTAIVIYPSNGAAFHPPLGTLNGGDAMIIAVHNQSPDNLMPLILDSEWKWDYKIGHGTQFDYLDAFLIPNSPALYNHCNMTRDYSIKISIASKDAEVYSRTVEFRGVKPLSGANYPNIEIPLNDIDKFNSVGNPYSLSIELRDLNDAQPIEGMQVPFYMQAIQKIPVKMQSGVGGNVTVSSNSTIEGANYVGQMRFEVTVSGKPGTNGMSTFFIPNSLLQSFGFTVGDISIAIDGKDVKPQITSVTGGYLLIVTYQHSTHTIILQFNRLDYTNYIIIAGVLVISVILGVFIVRKKRSLEKK